MGSYATTSSLSQLIPNALAGGTTTSDTEAVATFSTHIDRAEGDINAVLAEKYSLPFTAVPPSVRSWSQDLACFYFLRAAVAQDGRVGDSSSGQFKAAYERLLAAQASGFKGVLAMTDGSLYSRKTSTRFLSSTKDYAPTFDQDDPKNWEVDPDRLDDISGERA